MPSPRAALLSVGMRDGIQALIRLLGWFTSIGALLVMSYIIHNWGRLSGGAVAAAMVGTSVSMLNDSWEFVSILDRSQSFHRLSPTRVLMHDLFALALTVGGIVLILFSQAGPAYDTRMRKREVYDKHTMTQLALYMLAAVCGWRFLFAVVGCFNTSRDNGRIRRQRRAEIRQQRRDQAEAEEASN